jgi:hypothetical protein
MENLLGGVIIAPVENKAASDPIFCAGVSYDIESFLISSVLGGVLSRVISWRTLTHE